VANARAVWHARNAALWNKLYKYAGRLVQHVICELAMEDLCRTWRWLPEPGVFCYWHAKMVRHSVQPGQAHSRHKKCTASIRK